MLGQFSDLSRPRLLGQFRDLSGSLRTEETTGDVGRVAPSIAAHSGTESSAGCDSLCLCASPLLSLPSGGRGGVCQMREAGASLLCVVSVLSCCSTLKDALGDGGVRVARKREQGNIM